MFYVSRMVRTAFAVSKALGSQKWVRFVPAQVPKRNKGTRTLPIRDSRCVAYREVPGTRQPTIVVVPGLHSYSHMNGMMANTILRYCDFNDYSCIVYDSECTGESSHLEGSSHKDVLFSHWIEDVITVVDKLTEGPVVLTGCSMGGWLSLVAALKIPHRVHGLVAWSPALNYVHSYYQHNRNMLPPEVRLRLDRGETHLVANANYGDALLKQDFAEDSIAYEIDLSKPVNLDCPIRILHGLNDTEVEPEQSMMLCKALCSEDVDLIYRKGSGHQLESPPDIELFLNTLDRLVKDSPVKGSGGEPM